MKNEKSWTFAKCWNESLEEGTPKKVLQPRERIWASEIGGSMVDRYLKMTGVQPSNPYDSRSLRKFEAGRIWEHIVGLVLKRAGILIDEQEWLKYQYEGLLPVTGKLDFIAGGQPDYDKALHSVKTEFEWLPPFISRATQNIVLRLKKDFPDGLKKIILEIKSCSSFMFERYVKGNTASPQHKFQNFHYLKAKDYQEGHIVYISKDDARLLEIGVFNPSPIEEGYRKDIEKITGYVRSTTRPPLENMIVFDEEFCKFSANFKVGYSTYLTYLYGIKNLTEFNDKYKPTVESWNRVLGRITEGKEMTKSNIEKLTEISKMGFDIELIKTFLKKEEKDEVTG